MFDWLMPGIREKKWLAGVSCIASERIDIESATPTVSKNDIPILLTAVAYCAIADEKQFIAHFFSKNANAADIITDVRREISRSMDFLVRDTSVPNLIANFDGWTAQVVEHCNPALEPMGLLLTSLALKEMRDNVGYLEALGSIRTAETIESTGDVDTAEQVWAKTVRLAERLSPKCGLLPEVLERYASFLQRQGKEEKASEILARAAEHR